MDYREFSRLISRKEIPSLLYFEGPEENLKQNALRDLRKAILPEGLEEMNENRFEAPETDELIAAVETVPFMSDRRLVVVRDHPAITSSRTEPDEALLACLTRIPPSTVLLFYNVLPAKHQQIRNAVQKQGGLVQFTPLKGQELTSFVTRAFRDLGRECDDRTAEYLIFIAGTDLNQLRQEAAKIAALHPDRPAILPEDIRALAVPSTESKVFAMVDAVVSGQDAAAFSHLRNLLQSGETRVMILSMLLRQFRLLQHVKIMQYEKRPENEIISALGFSPFIGKQYIRQAAGYSGRQVREAVALCLDTDLAVKSGVLREEGALEAVMLKLLLLRKPDSAARK